MKKRFSRYLSLILSVCMVLSMCAITSFASDETAELDSQPVYYVRQGATGNGLSATTPGSFATVVADINSKYGAGDIVTVKILKGEYDDVVSLTADASETIEQKLAKAAHACMEDIPAHTATLLLTSADPNNLSRLAWSNDYQPVNHKGSNITLTGPTILKDIKMIDARINYYRDFYCMGQSLKVDTGVKWYCCKYASGTFTFEGRNYTGGIGGGARVTKTFKSPVLIEFADNTTSPFTYLTFSGYNTSGVMTFNEDITMKVGAGKTCNITIDEMSGTYALFKKNVNLVLNGTTLSGIINLDGKTDAQLPVVQGAFQVIVNKGATVGKNTFRAYKDEERTTEADIFYITSPNGATLDVTSVAGKYSVDCSDVVYVQSSDLKTAWYSKDGYITITEPGTYTLSKISSADAIADTLDIPTFSSIYTFDGWVDDGNGTITATSKMNDSLKYYVKADSDGDATTPETAGTMKTAMTALGDNDGFIFVIGEYTMPSDDYAAHAGNITIEGYDSSAVLASKKSDGITFGGPVTFKNITYKRGEFAYLLTAGKDVTFDEGFATTSNDDWMVFGGGANSKSTDHINVTVNSGNFTGKFNVGAIMPASTGFAVKNDAKVTLNGGSIQNILLGSTNWGTCGAVTFEKSVVIVNNGGTISKISATATGNGSPTKINGSFVLVNNNTESPAIDESLDSIAIGSKYIVNSGVGGKVTPVFDDNGNFSGKFMIEIESDAKNRALIENGDDISTLEESGEITLNPGTTTISYGDYPPNPGKTIPMTWKEMDKGYITLIFDDVRADFKKIFEIVSKEYNLPLCAAVPSNNIKNDPQTLHELQDRGGEILSHTKSHMVIKPFQTSWADVEIQLGDSYRILTEEGFNINGIILAGGTGQIAESNTEYRGLIELVTNKYYKYSDKYGLSTQYWKQRNWFSDRTLDQLKGIVDTHAQNKTWEVIYGHDLTEVSEENLRAFCEYLVQLQNEGKIKVVTYKYMHENFGDWESPVDFGDTTYTVEFYGTDHTTLVGKQVVVEGTDAKALTDYTLAEGYTLTGWDGNLTNVDNNRKVYAVCKDSSGNTVGTDVDSVITPPAYVAPTLFYVSESGSDSYEGTSPDYPLATIAKAISIADPDKDFEIKIIGSFTLPDVIQGYNGTLTISGYDSASEIKTVANGGYSIKSKLTIENIKFTNGLYAWFSANGYTLTIGENVTTSGNHQIVAGGNYGTVGTGVHDIKVYSGTVNKLSLGGIATGSTHAVTGDSKAEIFGGTINSLIIGNDGWSANHKNSSYASNVTINIHGGTVKNLLLASNNYAPVLSGAVMVILNNGTAITTINSNITALDNKYIVYSDKGGTVDFVYENGKSVAGKIKISPDEGKYALVENGGAKTYICVQDTVDIQKGETKVTYGNLSDLDIAIRVKNGSNEYIFGVSDSVKISVGGTISFPEDIIKDGFILGGWYSDAAFTTPVIDGSTITAGTTIYAKWIELNEKDLYVEGVQIRITAPTGLRFVNNISHATREALTLLNEENASLNPENAAFNATDGISYGTVVLPFDFLGEQELVKGGLYEYGDKVYAAKNVPAKNTFEVADGFDRYTAVLINVPEKNLVTNYTARPYITYTDASGVTRTVYGQQYTASLHQIADIIYRNGATEFEESQRESVLTFLYEKILSKVDGIENPLANTYRALNNDKKLTVGFLGGSITDGSSAKKLVQNGSVSASGGDISLSYVNRTATWLEENFPLAEIEVINAGISDTATNFGIYRLESHLMNTNGHDMPDLVFVEFNSNDWIYDDCITQTKKDLSRQVESLVRNIRSINPYVDIIFVSTARSATDASRIVYREIAEQFDITCIDMGIPMQALMTANGASNEAAGTYRYTTDNLHPSVEGYGVYFEEIKKVLTEYLIDTPVYYKELYNHQSNEPEQINRSLWLNPEIIPASEFEVSGSVTTSEALFSPMYGMKKTTSNAYFTPDSITVSGEDAKASFEFYGTSFGLIFNMNASGFNIDYTIDGKDVKNVTVDSDFMSYQKYTHNQIFIFEQELAYGKHKIDMTFKPTSDGKVNVKIGGAAVAGVDNGMDKLVALTIDDGPENISSNAILDILEEYGAHATFFCVGVKCNDNTKDVLNRMLALDCEIGNHSNTVRAVAGKTVQEVLDDFNTCQQKIYDLTGVYPAVYRAPGNNADEAVYAAIPVPIMYGYGIGSDWNSEVTYESRLSGFRRAVGDGRVVLIHDVEENLDVLEIMIPEIINQGYMIVTATELYTLRGYNPPKYAQTMYRDFAK